MTILDRIEAEAAGLMDDVDEVHAPAWEAATRITTP